MDDDVRDWEKITIPKNDIMEDLSIFLMNMDMARLHYDALGTPPSREQEKEIWEISAGSLFKTLEDNNIVLIEGAVQ